MLKVWNAWKNKGKFGKIPLAIRTWTLFWKWTETLDISTPFCLELCRLVLFCLYMFLAANGGVCVLWWKLLVWFTDICFILTPKEGPQVPVLLEYLPPCTRICHTCPWHPQHFQRLWHLASCKEMEIGLHNCDHCIGCDCLVVGSHYLDCSVEEEIQQVHQALWWIQQWRRQAIVALLCLRFGGLSTAAHLFLFWTFLRLVYNGLIFSSIIVYYIYT